LVFLICFNLKYTSVRRFGVIPKHCITHVDFCNIDTEGSELEVIESINFDTTIIDVFLIEDNYGDIQVKNALEKLGYTLVSRVGIDNVFLLNKRSLKY